MFLAEYDILSVGVLGYPLKDILKFVLPQRKELQMAFSFDHVRLGYPTGDRSRYQDWTLIEFKKIMTSWQNGLQDAGAWHALYLENHDQVSLLRLTC